MLCLSKNIFSGVVGGLEVDTSPRSLTGVGDGCSLEGKTSAPGYCRVNRRDGGELTLSVLEASELTGRKFSEDHRGLV